MDLSEHSLVAVYYRPVWNWSVHTGRQHFRMGNSNERAYIVQLCCSVYLVSWWSQPALWALWKSIIWANNA